MHQILHQNHHKVCFSQRELLTKCSPDPFRRVEITSLNFFFHFFLVSIIIIVIVHQNVYFYFIFGLVHDRHVNGLVRPSPTRELN